MAGFYVVESELDTFAAHLDEMNRSVPTAKSYATQHIDTGFLDTGVILAGAAPTVDRVRTSISAVLARLGDITTASAAHVRETAATYRAADDETDRHIRAVAAAVPATGNEAGTGTGNGNGDGKGPR